MQTQRRGRERSSSMKRMRCHWPRQSAASATGIGLAGGAEQHRHAVRVAVSDLHVLLADVLGAAVPVVVGVVRLVRDEAPQERAEVLEHPALVLVHTDAARRVRRVDAADPVEDAGLTDDLRDVLGDVGDVKAAGRLEVPLGLEDLHRGESNAAGGSDYAGTARARSSAVRAANS